MNPQRNSEAKRRTHAQIDPQEDFRKWREGRERGLEIERRDDDSYFINAWAKIAYLANFDRNLIGQELAKLQRRVHRQRVANRKQLKALQAAEARIGELEGALEFYADKNNYEIVEVRSEPEPWDSIGITRYSTMIAEDKFGSRAREALNSTTGSGEGG